MGNLEPSKWWLPPSQRDRKPAPEHIRKAVGMGLRAGASERTVADVVGIPWDQFEEWVEHDVEFAKEVRRGKAAITVRAAGSLRSAMLEDWRAALVQIKLAAQDEELERLKAMTTDG